MKPFPFQKFHSNWGQMLNYQRNFTDPNLEGGKRTVKKEASFIVQEITEESLRIQFNIADQDTKKFYSETELSNNDIIHFNNKEYNIIEVVDQYPEQTTKQWRYIASVAG